MFEKHVFQNLGSRYFSKDLYSFSPVKQFCISMETLLTSNSKSNSLNLWFYEMLTIELEWRSNSQCYEGYTLQSKRKSFSVLVFWLMNLLNPLTILMFVRCGSSRINDIFRAIFLYMVWCLQWWLPRSISFSKEQPLINKADYIWNYRAPHSRSLHCYCHK